MKVNIIAVGKIKEKYFADAIAEYKKRLNKFCELSIIEVPEKSAEKNIQVKAEEESKLLLAACKGTIIVLDRCGKSVSSPKLAEILHDCSLLDSTISFVIGGSNGVTNTLLKNAKYVLSFGEITFPHQLFRVVLAEQIYRAFSIIAGMPYHK